LLLLVSLLLLPSSGSLAQQEDKGSIFVFTLAQDTNVYRVFPIEGALDVVSFYDYYSASGHTPFMEDKVSKIYLYRNTVTQGLSLVMHHAIDEGALDLYSVKMDLRGVPEEAHVALADDAFRNEFLLENEPEGNWEHTNNSDGGALSRLPTDKSWSISITPDFISGIAKWEYLTQPASGVESIDLDMGKDIAITMSEVHSSGGNGCFIATSDLSLPLSLKSRGCRRSKASQPFGWEAMDTATGDTTP